MEYRKFLPWQANEEIAKLHQVVAKYPWQVFAMEYIQKDVYKIIAKEGIFCLKLANKSKAKMKFVLAAINYLWQQGYDEMPKLVATATGEDFVEQGDDFWFAVAWLPGQQCVFAAPGHLVAAVKNLAEFHLVACNFAYPDEPKQYQALPRRFALQNQNLLDFAEPAKSFLKSPKQAEQAISKLYSANCAYYLEQGQKAAEILESCDYHQLMAESAAKQVFIHGDVAARNFIVSQVGEEIKHGYLIDFDYAKYDLQIIDLSRFLERALRMTDYRVGNVDEVLTNYNQHKTLSDLELKVLKAMAVYPQRFWRLCERGFNRKVQAESVYRRLSYLLANRKRFESCLAHLTAEYGV